MSHEVFDHSTSKQSVGMKPSSLFSLRTQSQCGCVERTICTSSFFLTVRSSRKTAEYGFVIECQRSINVDVKGPFISSSSSPSIVCSCSVSIWRLLSASGSSANVVDDDRHSDECSFPIRSCERKLINDGSHLNWRVSNMQDPRCKDDIDDEHDEQSETLLSVDTPESDESLLIDEIVSS